MQTNWKTQNFIHLWAFNPVPETTVIKLCLISES